MHAKEEALQEEREHRQKLQRTFDPLVKILPQLQGQFATGDNVV